MEKRSDAKVYRVSSFVEGLRYDRGGGRGGYKLPRRDVGGTSTPRSPPVIRLARPYLPSVRNIVNCS